MPSNEFPSRKTLNICFAHVAYQMATIFEKRNTDITYTQAWTPDEVTTQIANAHVLVVSGFWRNDLLDLAPNLRFIQSIGAGYDQFPLDELKPRGIRLASARGVNKNAVSEHAMALILGITRQIHTGRSHQHNHHWRGMISDLSQREDELGGKTLLIYGMGDIGARVAKLAKAFDMHVIAIKRNPATAQGPADNVYTPDRFLELLPQADFVALTCPLTPETANLMNTATLGAMKNSAYLINVARGGCVNEADLASTLRAGTLAGAGLDVFVDEPLPADSPFWEMANVIITPHTGGETRKYEDNVIDILLENLERLWRGETELQNQIV